MMDCRIFPIFGKSKVDQITKEQIRTFHTQLGQRRAPSTANRMVTVVGAVYNFGIREGLIDCVNPCAGLRKYKTVSRDRFLNTNELDAFHDAIEGEEPLFRDFFKLLLYTGARKTNVLMMKWTDINFELKRWRISETQTKNKEVNIVALSESALKVLETRREAMGEAHNPDPYVFTGSSADGYLKDPKRTFDSVRNRMNVKDIRMHDLRRTLGSYMAISCASLPVIGKALNHKSQVSTAIYARLSQDPVLQAINIAADLLSR